MSGLDIAYRVGDTYGMREVKNTEVYEICKAGGKVRDRDGDVWEFRYEVYGFKTSIGEFWPVDYESEYPTPEEHYAPFHVIEEPPAEPTPQTFTTRAAAVAYMAQNPGVELYTYTGKCRYRFTETLGLEYRCDPTDPWSRTHVIANLPLSTRPPEPVKPPATDAEILAYLQSSTPWSETSEGNPARVVADLVAKRTWEGR